MEKIYIAIDLKSFYASVECVERGLDPLTTNLVVADASRTEKTICLAVSPSLKAYGIPGRTRLFEVVQKTAEINCLRRNRAPGKKFSASSYSDTELKADPSLELSYITAPPRMKHYMDYSTAIYNIYLKYISPEDIHVYSIDEVFIDASSYLKLYRMSPREFTIKLIREVLFATGITATAGIGSNLYLCKIAMDIVAKHVPADKDGVRLAELNERSYREQLWGYQPLTDFWRIGPGYSKKLQEHGLFTMGDIARTSLSPTGQRILYKLFGVNAELLIDHAWGREPVTLKEIKAYRPESNSFSHGQVLTRPYSFEAARQVTREMTEEASLDLVEKGLTTDQLVLTVGYDSSCLDNPKIKAAYNGTVAPDRYGKPLPKYAHGSRNLPGPSSSTRALSECICSLFDETVNPLLLVRRITVCLNHVKAERVFSPAEDEGVQLSFFEEAEGTEAREDPEKERRRQKAILDIRRRYGKNAILTGSNLTEDSTVIARNSQVGGHNA